MVKASAENVFVGAVVSKGEEKYLVIKVNSKSMYIAKDITLEDYNRIWDMRPKGETFKTFCEKHGYEMVKYDAYQVEENEAAKKNVIEETKKASNDASSVFGKTEKAILTELLKYKKLHRLANIDTGNGVMRVLERKDDDKFFINVNKEYVLYNRTLDAVCDICSVFDYHEKYETVPWEKITPKAVAAPAK